MYSCMPVYMSSDDDIKSCMMTYSYHLLEINKYRNVLLAKHPSSSRTDITVISGGSVKGEYAALTMAVMSQGCHKLCHNPPEKAPCRIFSCNRRKSPLVCYVRRGWRSSFELCEDGKGKQHRYWCVRWPSLMVIWRCVSTFPEWHILNYHGKIAGKF